MSFGLPIEATPPGFAEIILGKKLFDWQRRALFDLMPQGAQVSIVAANGSGKTSQIATSALLWNAFMFPGSLTVTTAGVFRQVKDQLWPEIAKYRHIAPGVDVDSTKMGLPNGSRALGFSTDDPGRFEGWHNENLLIIVDEAKSVNDKIYEAIERCKAGCATYRILLISSAGLTSGEFYRSHTSKAQYYKRHKVTAYDCPNIPAKWIQDQIDMHGKDSPLVKSMILSQFIDESELPTIFSMDMLRHCRKNEPAKMRGQPIAFIDFSAGGDEMAIAVMEGNVIQPIIGWRDKNTMSSVGRALTELRSRGIPAERCWGDAGGMGLPMIQRLREVGYNLNDANNGAKAFDKRYANRGAEMWWYTRDQVEKCKVIMPEDAVLDEQLSKRLVAYNSAGILGVEPKDEMRSRGLPSPDRADAVCGVVACGTLAMQQEVFERLNNPFNLQDEPEDSRRGFHFA